MNKDRAVALEDLLALALTMRNARRAWEAAVPRSPGNVAIAQLRKASAAADQAFDAALDALDVKGEA
jgi:hypothetical protein